MLHQTLIFSPSAALLSKLCSSPSPSPRYACPAALQRSKVEEEGMEATRKSSNMVSGDELWSVERGFGEAFSVDDLLDLGDFGDGELESDELVEQLESEEHSNSCSSVVSFDLPPPPSLEDMALPAHDAADLEWVSLIIDDTLPHIPTPTAPKAGPFTSPTICALSTELPAPVPVRAKRSKRRRSAGVPSASWSASSTSTASSASSSSSASSFIFYDAPPLGAPKRPKTKKRGRKPKLHYPPTAAPPLAAGERRCSHCGVQKTPQWRAGPLGAKTLCNACGVRFKSGRLLPEYRPACSPTFVNALHSNSHRKVLEMRRKKEADFLPAPALPPVASY